MQPILISFLVKWTTEHKHNFSIRSHKQTKFSAFIIIFFNKKYIHGLIISVLLLYHLFLLIIDTLALKKKLQLYIEHTNQLTKLVPNVDVSPPTRNYANLI